MYTIETITPPATEPVSVAELKDHLHMNHDDEDTQLAQFITSARELFESWTGRAVHPTGFRQHVPYLNSRIYLMRAPVTAITAVKYYDAEDQLQTASGYYTDRISTPASVWFQSYPVTSPTITPKAFVEFTAGWDEAAVPEGVKLAIKLLAGHYYDHREAFGTDNLTALPMGFRSVCDQYKTGLIGPWGM